MKKLRRWSNKEDLFLKNNYNLSLNKLSVFLNRSIPAIKNRKKFLKITINDSWSLNETNLLLSNYNNCKKEDLLILLSNRTWKAILSKAKKFKLNRTEYHYSTLLKCDISILLNNSNQSLYYIGLLMADGYFTNKKLSITQSIKDENIVLSFAKYINTNNIKYYKGKSLTILGKETLGNDFVKCEIGDYKNIPKILYKYNIIYERNIRTKTYFPPSTLIFDSLSDMLFLCYFIGFVDGDGSISKNGRQLTIRLHKNWMLVLIHWKNRLEIIYNCKMSKKAISIENDIVSFRIYNSKILFNICKLIIKTNLNVNNRKWIRIKN